MNFLNKCSVLTGVATLHNDIFVTVMNDALAEGRGQHAIPLHFRNDSWSSISAEPVLPWLVAGIASSAQTSSPTVIVGWGGQVLVMDYDNCHREAILRKDSNYVSIIRSIVAIGDVFYAVGMRRQVYRRTANSEWEEIDHDVLYQGDRIDVGFNAVDGFDRKEVYTAGSNGEIWRYDDKQWHEIQAPTSVHLHTLCCADDGYVYVDGKYGVLLRGRHDSWEILDIEIEETIWDVHWFKDKLYLVAHTGVYLYSNGIFEKIQNDLLDYEDFLCFSSSRSHLWIFGRKRIVQYDGVTWNEAITDLSEDVLATPVLSFFNDAVLLTGSDYLDD
jgi:hypothetical protein